MALYYDEDDEREYYEFEPLPTLLEDEVGTDGRHKML